MRRVVSPTPQALGEACARDVARLARDAVTARGAFHVALSGGSTPKHLYAALRELHVPWERVFVYFSDERTVPPGHADSNYRLARDHLLSHVPIPEEQVFRMRGELDPHEAARAYEAVLPERLDLNLLGMGDDGHTASLFPETAALSATGRVAANFVPKLDTWRVTFTFPEINASRERWILAAGASKAGVLQDVAGQSGRHPVERVEGPVWYLDEAAAARLS